MTRPMSEEREKLERALETARWIVKTTEANPDSHAGLVARALLSTSASERGMREALEKAANNLAEAAGQLRKAGWRASARSADDDAAAARAALTSKGEG